MTERTTMRATLGSKLISNAAAFFRNNPRAVLDEVIQNARRAGATRITFAIEDRDLVVEDDGTGLERDDAEVLLALGSSANGGGVERDEAAAGIGFFALAHHTVQVRTRDWRCTIDPDQFVGERDVDIVGTEAPIDGMILRIEGFVRDRDETLETLVKAAQYCGIQGFLRQRDGLLPMPSDNFLEDFERRDCIAASRIVDVPGARVRVLRCNEDWRVFSGPGMRAPPLYTFNFHGKQLVADVDVGNLDRGLVSLDKPARVEHGHIRYTYMRTMVLVEVLDTRSVRLRLPDRDSVIDEPRLGTIADAALALFIEVTDVSGGHGIPSGNGIAGLPAPTVMLRGLGRDAENLIAGPRPGTVDKMRIVDIDGLEVDGSALLVGFDDATSHAALPHVIDMGGGRRMRLIDAGTCFEEQGIELDIARIAKVKIVFDTASGRHEVAGYDEEDLYTDVLFEADCGRGIPSECRAIWIDLEIEEVDGSTTTSPGHAVDSVFIAGFADPDSDVDGQARSVAFTTAGADMKALLQVAKRCAYGLAREAYDGDSAVALEEYVELVTDRFQATVTKSDGSGRALVEAMRARIYTLLCDLDVDRKGERIVIDLDGPVEEEDDLRIRIEKAPKPRKASRAKTGPETE